MKSIIFSTFFTILSQESHQNFMWKVVTSFNLNPPPELFFYSPILANYLKFIMKYCGSLSKWSFLILFL